MTIKDLLGRKTPRLVTIGEHATLRDAVTTLVDNKVGALPVKDGDGALVGIITERDIMREVYAGTDLEGNSVSAFMTRNMITGTVDQKIEYVMEEMTDRRFRHMPIIGEAGLVGIISIGDIVKAQLEHTKAQVHQLKDYIAEPTL